MVLSLGEDVRVDKQSMPYASTASYWTRVQYDALARPSSVITPDGTTTSYTYDGLTTSVTDANLATTSTTTDILGRTVFVDAPTGPDISFTYDPLGNLHSAMRGGAEVLMSYDNAGRKKTMNDPDMGNWIYDYDALGNLLSQTDARGCVTTLQYDLLNRLMNKSYSNCPSSVAITPSVTYGYDSGTFGIGQRTSMSMGDASSSAVWEYDERGRLRKETKTIGTDFITEWTYNSADLPITMKYPDGEVVTTNYTDRMLLEKVSSDNGTPTNLADDINYAQSITYDTAGRMTTRTLGNGLTQTYHYYDWNEQVNSIGQGGRLETLVTGTLQNLTYIYDKVGNISRLTNSVAGETSDYEYDELNRLKKWTLGETIKNYAYDSAGNLDSKGDLDLQYNDTTHVHAVTDAGSNTYDYDQNGNQTRRLVHTIANGQPVTQEFELGYDAENRLVSVTGVEGTILTANFDYDGNGQRVKSVINDVTTLFIGGYYEVLNPGPEQTVTRYYFAGASRIAMRKYSAPQIMELEYFLGDHLGSTSITTDSAGAKVSEMRYEPWGEVRYHWVNTELITEPLYTLPKNTFTGQYSYMDDPSTQGAVEGFGLMFYQSRFYDPQVGRFSQADSIVPGGVQGLDRYAYTANNPVRYIDPSGHRCIPEEECEGLGYRSNGNKKPVRPHFTKSPVSSEDLEWTQWFGGTEFAYQGGSSWGYGDYCQGYHCGIDFGADWGDPVYAGVEGEVVDLGKNEGGYFVVIQVGDYQILYQGLDGEFLVEIGQTVAPDTIIAGVGNHAADESAGNTHLHLEIRYSSTGNEEAWKDRIDNPLHYMVYSIYELLLSVVPVSPWDNVTFHTTEQDPFLQISPIIRGGPELW